LERRWQAAETRPVAVYWATRRAVCLVGGIGGPLRQRLQVQHDLGVAAVYFRILTTAPVGGEQWIGEDVYRRDFVSSKRGKIPDAALLNSAGSIDRVIEIGGLYPPERLRTFHKYWSKRSIPYDLW
jgi:hypothetical protein